jgi:hypothetical protein
MKPSEAIRAARAIIAPTEQWAIGWVAYDQHGNRVDHRSPDACRWCAIGALCKILNVDCINDGHVMRRAYSWILKVIGDDFSVGEWQDRNGHDAILDAMFRGAKLAEAAGE